MDPLTPRLNVWAAKTKLTSLIPHHKAGTVPTPVPTRHRCRQLWRRGRPLPAAAATVPQHAVMTVTIPNPGTGFNDNLFQAIRKLRAATLAPRHLGAPAAPAGSSSSLISTGTVNADICHYRNVYDSKMNLSFSFEPRGLTCFNCTGGPHHILGEEYQPACIILCDQHFPAALPADEGLRCPAIIRAEDATISDLVTCFRKTMGKSKLPVGTVIMIGSFSHLARVGSAAYAADLQVALTALEDDYGGRIRTVHALPFPSSKIEDVVAIRAMCDIMDWLSNIDKRAKYFLPETQGAVREKLLCSQTGRNVLSTVVLPLRLPAGFKSKDVAAFSLGGDARLSQSIPACEGPALVELLAVMLQELNANFSLNLDTKPDMNGVKKHCTPATTSGVPIVVAGSSHAARLAGALAKQNENVSDLSISGWKLSEANANSLAEDIAEKLEESDNKGAVVLQLFDNSIFCGNGRTAL
jgi:hypothetical protein